MQQLIPQFIVSHKPILSQLAYNSILIQQAQCITSTSFLIQQAQCITSTSFLIRQAQCITSTSFLIQQAQCITSASFLIQQAQCITSAAFLIQQAQCITSTSFLIQQAQCITSAAFYNALHFPKLWWKSGERTMTSSNCCKGMGAMSASKTTITVTLCAMPLMHHFGVQLTSWMGSPKHQASLSGPVDNKNGVSQT